MLANRSGCDSKPCAWSTGAVAIRRVRPSEGAGSAEEGTPAAVVVCYIAGPDGQMGDSFRAYAPPPWLACVAGLSILRCLTAADELVDFIPNTSRIRSTTDVAGCIKSRVQRQRTGSSPVPPPLRPEMPVTSSYAGARSWHRHGWRVLLRRVVQ